LRSVEKAPEKIAQICQYRANPTKKPTAYEALQAQDLAVQQGVVSAVYRAKAATNPQPPHLSCDTAIDDTLPPLP
jgi:hypothetical protein